LLRNIYCASFRVINIMAKKATKVAKVAKVGKAAKQAKAPSN